MKKGLLWLLIITIVLVLLAAFALWQKARHFEARLVHATDVSEYVLEHLADVNNLQYFDDPFFEQANVTQIKQFIANECMWTSRYGKFVDFFRGAHTQLGSSKEGEKSPWSGASEQLLMIYEYNLGCGELRFILSFHRFDELAFTGIYIEPQSVQSPWIVSPQKQLKYGGGEAYFPSGK
ncbi:hypothetical protein [Salinibius halmophilus]|uniref:hypothetical protein n=1 Tax=Salinibius halmophilus TaxID=1853216 RepID=UPI001313D969|nr:hypothetical protein [Salinibius halmophilus]